MFKSLYTTLLCLCAAIMPAVAQHAPGSWRILPMNGISYEKVVETPSKVYFVSKASSTAYTVRALYCYDKESGESQYQSPGDRISASDIADLYYNKDGKYLLVSYESGNIDLIYEDGRTVNLPEIRDAVIYTDSRKINEVNFYKNRILVATDFGLVIYDDQSHNVIESAIYGYPVQAIFGMNDHLFIRCNNKVYVSPLNERHNSLDKFDDSWGYEPFSNVRPLSESVFIATKYDRLELSAFYPNFVTKKFGVNLIADNTKMTSISPSANGYVIFGAQGMINVANDATATITAIPAALKDNVYGSWNGATSVWAADQNGVGNYNITTSTPTVLAEKYTPMASQQFEAYSCVNSPDGSKVYIGNAGYSSYHSASLDWDNRIIVDNYDWSTGEISHDSPLVLREELLDPNSRGLFGTSAEYGLIPGGMCGFDVDPIESDLLYISNRMEGLLIVKDGKLIYAYNKYRADKSPLQSGWCTQVFDAKIDPYGNLWVANWNGNTNVKMLSKAGMDKLRKDPSSVSTSDWVIAKFPSNHAGSTEMKLCATRIKPGKLLYTDGTYQGHIFIYDFKGTASISDDVVHEYSTLMDQDGNTNSPISRTILQEDKSGNIWIGTSEGIYVLEDLDQQGSDALRVRRPKVPRNDGTNYVDYLLPSDVITGIAVDGSNRKWITTQSSGAYLVNADGTEILETFTKENSPFLSNEVFTVACDPNGNDVLFGTRNGLYIYSSTSAPASDDYSNVIAYPNPVRPDYSGWITIQGLMDNSLVKIADPQGNVIATGRSEGGMYVWDGCNSAGQRVSSGVYTVFASSSDGTNSDGAAVTRIVMIK